ncbi:hypothetical protein GLYMA_01G035202v4 [Glycine max]|uniref:Uncharacterized protein n=1 Tax=Glycine soja TaxID=3848 RepID=A0A0B2SEZ0_GLYSO|nr:hypothetical protein GLYMA_01G035202v4 [Glycine max]KAG4403117.1 hypothetical protein GLYMA_01G035202v4 [Glycine max]KAH1161456.1 hypothetical protein GYH30_000361 [Glycine max]KAH1161457.1 hypothetical protein GYH30_000361 [Glycine max]KHN45291.1 hypothetical protein glysoja_042790 [Glycine soja]
MYTVFIMRKNYVYSGVTISRGVFQTLFHCMGELIYMTIITGCCTPSLQTTPQPLTYMDWVFGTDIGYKKLKASKRAEAEYSREQKEH